MPDSSDILSAAVDRIGGTRRDGQHEMALAVDDALASGKHLLIQAGTGTGKSLGYLIPALRRAVEHGERVVVATATLALQTQLADKDIPVAVAAVESCLGIKPTTAVLKGRTNYACLYRARDGVLPEQESLLGSQAMAGASGLGAEVIRLREWVEEQATAGGVGDRDGAPAHSHRAWQQVSIPPRECLATSCPFYAECLVEESRKRAHEADLVVTNHALLAIDAMNGATALPEHEAVIIDEAHELVSRITSAATDDLTAEMIAAAARRSLDHVSDDLGADFLDSADGFGLALMEAQEGRISQPDHPVSLAAARVRDLARQVASSLGSGKEDPQRFQASGAAREVFDVAARLATLSDADVAWVSATETGRFAHVAPLQVAGLLRSQLFSQRTTVLTSATLSLGGDFDAMARTIGLLPSDFDWHGIDVGSPFDYAKQGILYIARGLPRPGRESINEETKKQIAQLVWAAGGRTLALFASRRAAIEATDYVRKELPRQTVLCQGDAQLADLTRRFAEDPETSLFGTLSLWQGIDVPGDTCQLVIIEKIPFPRPDDPLLQARAKAVDDSGGNGFMSVSATHAALLLAQGAGRLIRRAADRGVVAVLDSRLATARYSSFLLRSMPPFWTTNDLNTASDALRRLRGAP